MKVDNAQSVGAQVLSRQPSASKGQESKGVTFDELLGRVGRGGNASSVAAPETSSPLGEIQAPMPLVAKQTASPVAEKTSKLISVLEEYAVKMASDEASLKEVESVVGEMDTLAQELAASLSQESDPNLVALAEQSAALAAIESIKFRRGDYL